MAIHSQIQVKLEGGCILFKIQAPEGKVPASSFIGHKITIINDVPVFAFEFTKPEENFFFHLNFLEVASEQEQLIDGQINGKLSFNDGDQLIRSQEFRLSIDDSFDVRRCFVYQQNTSTELIEASVDFIYDKPLSNYEWLR